MITIEDGIPIIAGRRFPWVYEVHDYPNECGARRFGLRMENGWTVWVYFNDAGEIGAVAMGRGWQEVAVTDGGEWRDIVITPDECLAFIDRAMAFESL